MKCIWQKSGKKYICSQCAAVRVREVNRNCPAGKCPHLGDPIEREGVTVTVVCGCNKKEHEQPHAAHECEVYKRCLPTLIPVDNEKWLARDEAKIYRACRLCELNPANARE